MDDWTYEEILQSLRPSQDTSQNVNILQVPSIRPPLAQALEALRQARDSEKLPKPGPVGHHRVPVEPVVEHVQPAVSATSFAAETHRLVLEELRPSLEQLKKDTLKDLAQSSQQQMQNILRLELTPKVRQELNTMLIQELQGKVRYDMQNLLCTEVTTLVNHKIEEALNNLMPDFKEGLKKECIALVSREVFGNGKLRQDFRAAIREERDGAESLRQELLTLVQQELLSIRTEMRNREKQMVQRHQQRLETLEQALIPNVVSQQIQALSETFCGMVPAVVSRDGDATAARAQQQQTVQSRRMEIDNDSPSLAAGEERMPPRTAVASQVSLSLPQGQLKRKASDAHPPPSPSAPAKHALYLRWGLIAAAQRMHAGNAEVDPELLQLLSSVAPQWWEMEAVAEFIKTMAEQEVQLRTTGSLKPYVQALLPHVAALPEVQRVQLRQLHAVQQFYDLPSIKDIGKGNVLLQLFDTLAEPSLTEWKLPVETLIGLLEKVTVSHLHSPLPQLQGPVAPDKVLKLLERSTTSSSLSQAHQSQFKIFLAIFANTGGLIRTINTRSSLESFKDYLQSNVSWLLSQGGGCVPAAWLSQFLVPINISLLTSELRAIRPIDDNEKSQQVMQTLAALHQNRDDFSDMDVRSFQGQQEGVDIDALEKEYCAALQWLLKECCCLCVEDPTFKTGMVTAPCSQPSPAKLAAQPISASTSCQSGSSCAAQNSDSALSEVNQLLQSQSQEVINFLHRTLIPAKQVNYDKVDWKSRLCSMLGSDQLLKFNEGLLALHEEVTSKYLHMGVKYEALNIRVKDKRRQEILEQVDRFFSTNGDNVNPKDVEVRRIPDDDPREPLRGQWGLFCAANCNGLPEYHILGPYVGYLRTSREYSELHATLASKVEHDRYCYVLSEQPGNQTLFIDAFGVGNQLMLINDCRLRPYVDDVFLQEPNVRFLEVMRNGWPHLFVMTVKKIKPGSELLIDYGPSYWDGNRMLNGQLTSILDRQKAAAEALRPLLAGTSEKPIHLD